MFSIINRIPDFRRTQPQNVLRQQANRNQPILHSNSAADVFFTGRPKEIKSENERKARIRQAQINHRLKREDYIKQLENAYRERFHQDPQTFKPKPAGKKTSPVQGPTRK